MQALDDFVARARSQNERHHATHISSLQGLASDVNESYSSIGEHFTTTYDRVRDIGNHVSEHSKALQATLPPLTQNIQQPLADLRSSIADASLREYVPTGETPQKMQYHFPTTLPRTEPHDKLLNKLFHTASAPSNPPPSPSKSIIYTDTPNLEIIPPSGALPLPPPPPSSSSEDPPKPTFSSSGLREIDLNISSNIPNRHSDPGSITTKPAAESIKANDM
ncbi:MAG: hypothetical protein Q9196_005413, partial [Gyalolechia fulgens]